MDDALDRFLDQLARLEVDQLRVLAATWEEVDPDARQAAWDLARQRLSAAGRDHQLERLREAVAAWAGDRAFDIMGVYGAQSLEWDRGQVRMATLAPVLDAGVAALAADVVGEDALAPLLEPWRAAVDGVDENGGRVS